METLELIPDFVSVIVPCRNEEKRINGLLQALLKQTYPLENLEVIIADGLSSDKTREVIAQFRSGNPELQIRVVDNPEQVIPTALNHAIDAARGEYIVRVDAHSVPSPTYIAYSIENLKAGKGENVGGLWLIKPGDNSWIAKSIAAAGGHKLGVGDARYRTSGEPGYVETVPFGSYRNELLSQLGGFDETLLTNEDYDLNHRIIAQGGKVYFDPKIQIDYIARSTLADLARQYWRYGYWKLQMLKKFPKSLKMRQALPPLFVAWVLIGGLLSVLIPQLRLVYLSSLLVYLIIVILSAIPVAIKSREPNMIVGVPLAIITMHLSWGSGFLWSLFKNWLIPVKK